jgi:drug/metabolite transporter (DMT)-like permease
MELPSELRLADFLSTMPASILPYVWMLLGAFAFAVMAFLASALRDDFDWHWIAIARSGLAMIFAAGLVVAGGARFVLLRPRTLWTRSLAGSVSLLCGFYAMTHYDVAVVLTLTNMYPLWVAILSWPLLGEVPGRDTWLAAAVGVAGICVLSLGTPEEASLPPGGKVLASAAAPPLAGAADSLPNAKSTSGALAIAASLVSAFTSAIALIGLHQLRGIDSRAIVTHFSGVALLACFASLLASGMVGESAVPRPQWSAVSLGSLLAVGLAATAGQLFLTKAFSIGSPARISVVGLSQVFFAMLLEAVFHGKSFAPLTLLGMALVIAPTAWVLVRGHAASDDPDPGDATL